MGEIEIFGPGALDFIQTLTVNDAARLEDGQVQYSALCFEDGGLVDDITIYRFSPERFLFCVNASNTGKDFDWIVKNDPPPGVEVRDRTETTALLALQGPLAEFILKALVDFSLPALQYYHFAEGKVGGVAALISRTGYTGEDGFELFVASEGAQEVWQKVMAAGEPVGLKPAGLGARDTLRMEMKYALYGNDIDETTDPLEAGLGWITRLEKGDFVGRRAIVRRSGEGPARKLVGLELTGRGVARHGHVIREGGREVGKVTSGTFSPSLRRAIGIGYVPADLAKAGTRIEIDIRGTPVAATVARTPFYRGGSVKK
jgi:aminomethyltransferase